MLIIVYQRLDAFHRLISALAWHSINWFYAQNIMYVRHQRRFVSFASEIIMRLKVKVYILVDLCL